jgi:hypothetical protein
MRADISLIHINIVAALNQSLDYLGFCSDFLFNGVCRVIVDIAYYYFPFMIYETHFENKKGRYLIKRTSRLYRIPLIKYAQNQIVGKQTNIKLFESKKTKGNNRMVKLVYRTL